MAQEYDVVVLGAGPGGYVAAIRAAQLGLKTAIVEKQWWGGVCLNVGCIPSKALLRNAELAHIFQHRLKDFGFSAEGGVSVDYSVAFQRSRDVSGRLVKGVQFLMRKNKIDTYNGWGTIQNKSTVSVELEDGKTEELKTKNLIIATGAETRLLPGTQVSENVITYLEAIMSDTLPESIVIAGAGPIGMEFAYVMHNYGVDVTIVEFLPHLLPLEDEEISVEIEKQYKRLGIKFMTGTRVESIEDTGSGVKVTVSKDGETQVLEAAKAMQAIGFKPRVEGYGLENIEGLKLTDRGAIEVDERMATNVEGVWAIGDVTAKLMLAHVGSAQDHRGGEHRRSAKYDARLCDDAPRRTASAGRLQLHREAGAAEPRDRGRQVPFTANGNWLGEPVGFVKLIADKQYGELLGGHMIGPDVTELLPELTLAQKWELTAYEIANNVHAHPTLSEALMEAAHGLEGHMINL